MWILGSLCDLLQEQVVSTQGNAKDLWDHLQGLFHDNKDARAINLDNELCSIRLEICLSMTIAPKSSLWRIGFKTLALWLDSHFTTIVKIICHCEPLPTFETTRNTLLLEESTLNKHVGTTTTFDSSSSSPTVLVASNSSAQKEEDENFGIWYWGSTSMELIH
ncbi:hybrid signal transduction histidine kinase M [Artemisia annua]|uniref:Hybrid signal transduction histidine kinase M n=1 Tax=Artemisia annua TaxID=35608 RepID=A0A2U1MMA2_ARTAN|nr:hybrid signal transduction histidine kinase M [Artemisia annua]